jgi:hypothetical protein
MSGRLRRSFSSEGRKTAKRDDLRAFVARQARESVIQSRTKDKRDFHASHNAMRASYVYFDAVRGSRICVVCVRAWVWKGGGREKPRVYA